MRLIIAGGRSYIPTYEDSVRLAALHAGTQITEVISGSGGAADRFGEGWAIVNGIPLRCFPADWAAHGRAAGPIRNAAMAAVADAIVLFPGGKGTRSMLREATAAGLTIHDWRGE